MIHVSHVLIPTTPVLPVERWLLLIHQLPAKPAYLRVKMWRRLQGLGAVAVKNAVYALPANEQAQEDFEWLLREIVRGRRRGDDLRGPAGRRPLRPGGPSPVRSRPATRTTTSSPRRRAPSPRRSATTRRRSSARRRKAQLARLQARLAQVVAIDFFGANGRETAEGCSPGWRHGCAEERPCRPRPATSAAELGDLKRGPGSRGTGVHVDRIASAWLIRRFIDPEARFKFVPARATCPSPASCASTCSRPSSPTRVTAAPSRCCSRALGLDDPALGAIAEIVHDIDLKDGKFGRAEADGHQDPDRRHRAATGDDDERLARGGAVFEDLYSIFSPEAR